MTFYLKYFNHSVDIFCLDFIYTIFVAFSLLLGGPKLAAQLDEIATKIKEILHSNALGGAGLGSPWLSFLFLATGPRIQCLCWQHQGELLLLLTFMQNIKTSPVFQTFCVLASGGDCVNFSKRAFPQTSKHIHSLDCFGANFITVCYHPKIFFLFISFTD